MEHVWLGAASDLQKGPDAVSGGVSADAGAGAYKSGIASRYYIPYSIYNCMDSSTHTYSFLSRIPSCVLMGLRRLKCRETQVEGISRPSPAHQNGHKVNGDKPSSSAEDKYLTLVSIIYPFLLRLLLLLLHLPKIRCHEHVNVYDQARTTWFEAAAMTPRTRLKLMNCIFQLFCTGTTGGVENLERYLQYQDRETLRSFQDVLPSGATIL